MHFKRVSYKESRTVQAEDECFLVDNNWDDFSYRTLFHLIYFDSNGTRHEIGSLKIMQRGMEHGRVIIKDQFRKLSKTAASLGTDQKYYENLAALGAKLTREVLESLRDAAWSAEIYESVKDERAFIISLTRGVRRIDIKKFSDIANGRATLTSYRFEYKFPNSVGAGLTFKVTPHVLPPTNIHTVIGRNGVGKTTLIKSLITLLCDGASDKDDVGNLIFPSPSDEDDGDGTFASLINVAFSAFDEIDLPSSQNGTKTGIRLSYIGLRRPMRVSKLLANREGSRRGLTNAKKPKTQLKSIRELANEFTDSLTTCLRSSKRDLWLSTIKILESDPIFASMQLNNLADCDANVLEKTAKDHFLVASSGHKIVLLSVTRLVELVEERTLVLIDEPEAHLHPPLQAAFIRALSSLLTTRNGVGLLATHSPVMLQEVPKDCVWLLFRDGTQTSHERPQVETFAENIGVLTREVFRLEVTQSGYHTLLTKEIDNAESLDDLFNTFRNHLGAEGRAIARSLWRRHYSTDTGGETL